MEQLSIFPLSQASKDMAYASSGGGQTCLIVLDFLRAIAEFLDINDATLECAAAAVRAARSQNIPIIFVRLAFRPGYQDAHPSNKLFSGLLDKHDLTESSPNTQILPLVGIREGDLVVVKRRVSAFAGTDMELLLRSMGVTELILTGISTSGAVLSTLRDAADLDYKVTILSDACADGDSELHQVLTEKVFPKQATVMSAKAWGSGLGGGDGHGAQD